MSLQISTVIKGSAAVVRHGTFVERGVVSADSTASRDSGAAVVRHGTFVERANIRDANPCLFLRWVPLSSDTAHSLSVLTLTVIRTAASSVPLSSDTAHSLSAAAERSRPRRRISGAAVVRHGTFVERYDRRIREGLDQQTCRCRQTRHIR